MNITRKKSHFGKLPNGEDVFLYQIENTNGGTLRVMNYGGIITSLEMPDRDGKSDDVVLGFDTLDDYLKGHPYFGAIIGRYGNRIAGGQFRLDGEDYFLAKNLGNHHLHGGKEGFDKKLWEASWYDDEEGRGVRLTYTSPHMEEGYPGELSVSVIYLLSENNELSIRYQAESDRPTVLNLTQHSYFNLNGAVEDIHAHKAKFNATWVLEIDEDLIPTGNLLKVNGGPFDFTEVKAIGQDIESEDQQMKRGGGYDHCFIIDEYDGELKSVATIFDPQSGRMMRVETTEPSVQFYTGNFMDADLKGKGKQYGPRMAFCIESQHYPDSPNHPVFPGTRLNSDEVFRSETRYIFSVYN